MCSPKSHAPEGRLRRIAAIAAFMAAFSGQAQALASELDALWRQANFAPRAVVEQAQIELSRARQRQELKAQLISLTKIVVGRSEFDESEQSISDIDQALGLSRDLKESDYECQLILVKAGTLSDLQRFVEARKLYAEAAALALTSCPQVASRVAVAEAWTEFSRGNIAAATVKFSDGYRTADQLEDHWAKSDALNGMANIAIRPQSSPNERARGIGLFRQALAAIDEHVYRSHACTLHFRLGTALLRSGDLKAAREELNRALVTANEIGNPLTAAAIRYNLAQLSLDEKAPQDSLRELELAEPFITSKGGPQKRFRILVLRAQAMSMLGQVAEAQQALDAARELRSQIKIRERDVEFHAAAATIFEQSNEFAQAYKEMQKLRNAERDVAIAAKETQEAELRARFDADRKDREFALLSAQSRAAQSRQLLLIGGLVFTVLFLLLLALVVRLQLKQKRNLSRLAFRDELTSLPNRRSILERARRAHALKNDLTAPMTLGLLDIDHFKRINDTYGHDVGDAVLRRVAEAAAKALRSSDSLGRYGGEEFLMVLPQCHRTDLSTIFMRLRAAVQAINTQELGIDRPVTFSMGIAFANVGQSIDDLLKEADEALYRAKRNGRDRMEVWEDPA
ncbi:diguanylate cyclase [Roseateles sp. NT4]|uniref:GGDEF domain-containing protein n=1 Tax=Roseateles sp. NT4 TaxID=3453715 RepID=UPI003EE97CBD